MIQNIFIRRYKLSVYPSLFERTISLVKVRSHVQKYRQEGVRSYQPYAFFIKRVQILKDYRVLYFHARDIHSPSNA